MNLRANLEDKKWISLFDLYFRYSSPIPYKHPVYNEFFCQLSHEMPGTRRSIGKNYYGFVTINHEARDSNYYARKKEKNVFFMKPYKKSDEAFYDEIWNTYYYRNGLDKYMDYIFEPGKFFIDKKRDLSLVVLSNMSTFS